MRNKNKILYLIHTPPPVHGVSKISEQIYRSQFINEGYQKKLIRLNLSTKIDQLRRLKLIQLFRFLRLFFSLFIKLFTYRPNLIYFTIMPVGIGFFKDALLVLLLKLFRQKILFHIHNRGISNYILKSAYSFLYKLVFKNTCIIHLSESLINKELVPFFSESAKFYVCENSVEDILVKKPKSSATINILFFSNLFVHKGLKALLKAATLLQEKGLRFKLIIAGAPTQKSKMMLEEFHENYPQLDSYIEQHGEQFGEEKQYLFNNADIFVFPSEFKEECMPLVILEALSAGLPVVASDIGAISSTVINEENGFLIPKRSPEILAQKIEALVEDKELRQSMGTKSRDLYLRKFTLQHQESRMREIFEKLLPKEK